jgi:hypothetical protein
MLMADRLNAHFMRVFLIVWGGQTVSLIGSALTSFALGIWVFQETGSALLYGLNYVGLILPPILFAPLAGPLADRADRRLVMIATDAGAALASLGIGLLFFSGRLAVWHVYAFTLLNASFSAFQDPAFSAATTLLVPPEHLGRASGLGSLAQSLRRIIAPAVAGVLLLKVALSGIVALDLLTFLIALGSLLLVRFPRPQVSAAGKQAGAGSRRAEALFGWRYILERPGLAWFALLGSLANFVVNFAAVLWVPMILSYATPDQLGLLIAVSGLGMFSGSLIVSGWGGPKRARIPTYAAFQIMLAAALILTALRPSLILTGIGLFLVMMVPPLQNAIYFPIWQRRVEADLQGRVFAALMTFSLSLSIAAFLLPGWLADRFFEPGMAFDGALAPAFGPLLGVGAGRGMALLHALAGVMALGTAAFALLNRPIRALEESPGDAGMAALETVGAAAEAE